MAAVAVNYKGMSENNSLRAQSENAVMSQGRFNAADYHIVNNSIQLRKNEETTHAYSDNEEDHHDNDECNVNCLTVQTYSGANQLMPFSGCYEDVLYPICTLFVPPHPPNELPARRLRPMNNNYVVHWENDLSLAGPAEHEAQCKISKIWRGIMCRRQLRHDRNYASILYNRARCIQCWWRCTMARKRTNQLRLLKQEWIDKQRNDFEADKMAMMVNIMKWQKRKYEGAASLIQRVVRWHLCRRYRRECARHHVPEDEWPELLPFPLKINHITYFPWRRSTLAMRNVKIQGEEGKKHKRVHAGNDDNEEDDKPRRRTILMFKKTRDPVEPVSLNEVRASIEKDLHKRRERARSLAVPEVQGRLEWKQENLRKENMEFNAGMIQRLYRFRKSANKVHSKELTTQYMNNVVRIIARSFRMYVLVRRLTIKRNATLRRVRDKQQRYVKAKIADIDSELVWGKELLDSCAFTIQKCWHWYQFNVFGRLPLAITKELERREAVRQARLAAEAQAAREKEELKQKLMRELGITEEQAAAMQSRAQQKESENVNTTNEQEEKEVKGKEDNGKDGEMAEKEVTYPTEEEPEQKIYPTEDEEEEKEEEHNDTKEEITQQEEEQQQQEQEKEQEPEDEGEYQYEEPTPPPYGLLDLYLQRQEELRLRNMSLIERNKEDMVKKHKYVTFKPKEVIIRKKLGVYLSTP